LSRIEQRSVPPLPALVGSIITPEPRFPFQVPGLGVLVERRDGTGAETFAGTDSAGTPFRRDTLFPIASASKLATGLAVFRLIDRGWIELDAPLSRYLPEARAAAAGVTIRMLMSHTSGLPLEVHPSTYSWSEGLSWRALAEACLDTPLQFAPAERVQYSNIGYGLLAQLVERITGAEFTQALDNLVIEPLGIEAYLGRADLPRRPAYIMGVESEHVGTALEPINSAFWRQLALPWAGLFTTADGLLSLLRVYDNSRPDLIRPETVAEARRNQAAGLSGGFGTTDPFLGCGPSHAITWSSCPWGLMVELRGEKRPHWAPPAASPESFGQIGATGCLAWFEPTRGVAWVIMAPRTTDSGWLLRHGMALGASALYHGSRPTARPTLMAQPASAPPG
jgi:beta-lactamase class C